MLLVDFKTTPESPWIVSSWQMTYRVSWEQICKAISAVVDYYDNPEVFVGQSKISDLSRESIKSIPENASITIRGLSKILGVPVMITFINQVQTITVYSIQKDKTMEINYKNINYELCQYLDSIELAMHR